MKQYCRYCAFCLEGDAYICQAPGDSYKFLTESQIRHPNSCENYVDCGLDIFTGEPRKNKKERKNHGNDNVDGQISLEEVLRNRE